MTTVLPSAPMPKTIDILGVPVACVTYETALPAACALARRDRPAAIAASNTHIVAAARHRPAFGKLLRSFDLILPDGMPLVWTLNAAGAGLQDRVYGPFFMRRMLQHTGPPWRHFFFGGTETTLGKLAEAARELNPEIDIAGTFSPPFREWTEDDAEEFARVISEHDPDFIWVALGGERQERWIIENQHRFRRGVFIAIGDAFELLAGSRPFAPDWMQRYSLTWIYRLWQEPRRLWRRYAQYNLLFLAYLALDGARGRAFTRTRK